MIIAFLPLGLSHYRQMIVPETLQEDKTTNHNDDDDDESDLYR